MPRRSGPVQGRRPIDFLRANETWPDGRLRQDAPVAARYARDVSAALAAALEGRSVSSVAAGAGLARSTIYDLLSGETWADLVSLASLEHELQRRLWPEEALGL